jgi:hypothetical protein
MSDIAILKEMIKDCAIVELEYQKNTNEIAIY